jgi:hypothetical protein
MIVQTLMLDDGRASIEIPFEGPNPFTLRLTAAAAEELGALLTRAAHRANIMEAFNAILQQQGETGYQSRRFVHDLYQQVTKAYSQGEPLSNDDASVPI